MTILLMGPPGSGKSTQAGLLAERLSIPRIMASEVLTATAQMDSPVAGAIHQAMTTGALVPDDIVSGVLIARLRRSDCANGFVLDGFPRTVPQAAALDQAAIRLNYVIELILEDAEVFRRLTGRRIHPPSGRLYHLIFNPPKLDDRDDVTGEPLVQRDDDREEVVRRRLTLYHAQAERLLDYYARQADQHPRMVQIKGEGEIRDVSHRLLHCLKETSMAVGMYAPTSSQKEELL
jgi:adenylate kinase